MDFVYPVRCPICDKVLPAGQKHVCDTCLPKLEFPTGKRCNRCSKPVLDEQDYCEDCRKKQSSFLDGRAVLLYNTIMQESIARFKYCGRQEYSEFYGTLLWEREGDWLQRMGADLLVPVPLHAAKYRSRGYNQAALVAKALGRLSGIPVAEQLLIRSKKTIPQKELSGKERIRNLQAAFVGDLKVRELYQSAKCVIIIDDIYTTGSTVEACARVLQTMNFKKICFLCICIGKDV